jgi:8-oxo-dGTP diphosphatase
LRLGDKVQKNPTIVLVVAAALMADDGRILLQKRRLGTAFGGLWEFPGGKIEDGETPEMALVREIYEELGVQLAVEDVEAVGFAHHQDQPHLILLYMCRKWIGDVQCLDGAAIGWFTSDEVAGLAMPPLDYPLVKALLRRI